MTRQEIFDAVQEIFRDVFDDEELVIEDGTAFVAVQVKVAIRLHRFPDRL